MNPKLPPRNSTRAPTLQQCWPQHQVKGHKNKCSEPNQGSRHERNWRKKESGVTQKTNQTSKFLSFTSRSKSENCTHERQTRAAWRDKQDVTVLCTLLQLQQQPLYNIFMLCCYVMYCNVVIPTYSLSLCHHK